MPNDNSMPDRTEAERQAQLLAAEIDAARDDLAANGPVSSAELRQRLEALEAEWADASHREGEAAPRQR